MWTRWQRGESLKAIGRVFDRPSSSIYGQLAVSGGIRPPARRRSRLALTLTEREEISRGIARRLSMRAIQFNWDVPPQRLAVKSNAMEAMIIIEPRKLNKLHGIVLNDQSFVS
jgi:hypothetical protein